MTTPTPIYSFDTGTGTEQISIGGSPADANIAVSSTHICITARAAFACYTKGGKLVNLGTGFQARPYTAAEFFTQSGHQIDPVAPGTPTKDGRVVFDQYRKRFFMAFQTREEHCHLLIAVSKSEDPRDGWWTYADNVESPDVNGEDYMWIGINATHFLISNQMSKCKGTYPNPPNPNDPWSCNFVLTRHFMYPVADLVVGQPYSRTEWSDPAANSAVPCVHDSYTTDAFWVHRDDNTHASVWAVRSGDINNIRQKKFTIQTSGDVVDGAQFGGTPVYYTGRIGRAPQNAHYRDGKIVFVSNDGHIWSGQSSPNNAVRLVRLDVSKYFDASPSVKVEIDRIFGRASAGDPSGSIFDYGWPAVATNGKGDIVMGSVRSSTATYAELRGSVWLAGQPDISSSVSLAMSSSPLSDFHMAGACADPSTDGVYLAQQYGSSSPSWRIHVAKVLGEVLPDLIATQVQPPASIAHGASSKVTVTITNQGDGPMPPSWGELYLSGDNIITPIDPDVNSDTRLATFLVPALAPNEVTNVVVQFAIPTTYAPGNYYVGVVLDVLKPAREHSKLNNANPFQVENHGNAPMIVT